MANLQTPYLGLSLKNPVIVSSSSLTAKVENIKKCEEAGASAVVLKSLFEEQIMADKGSLKEQDDMYYWYPEAMDYFDKITKSSGIKDYLKLIRDAIKSVNIPVIASINCVTANDWVSFAKDIEDQGADALELNIAIFPQNQLISSDQIEVRYFDIVKKVKSAVSIPVAVKIGNHFTNYFSIADKLHKAGADALVLFNRFYKPDIDIENIRIISDQYISDPSEIKEVLRWVALLSDKFDINIAATTGIHSSREAIQQILSGADAVQVCSALYKNGIDYLEEIIKGIETWMKNHNFSTVDEFKGKIKEQKESTAAFERIQFMKKTTGIS